MKTAVFAAAALSLAALPGCANQQIKDRQMVDQFKRDTAGQYENGNGAQLFIVPVRSRMVADESMYIERIDANGAFGRLLDLKVSDDGKTVVQLALAFTQEGQWRDLRENPELFTALLPKDVRSAGTCSIQPSADLNSVSYSCSGSEPETFKRK
jgi:hypothetical protein